MYSCVQLIQNINTTLEQQFAQVITSRFLHYYYWQRNFKDFIFIFVRYLSQFLCKYGFSSFMFNISMFRKFLQVNKRENHEQAITAIQDFLKEIAAKTSERAMGFVERLKNIDLIDQNQLFQWTYKIKNSSISPICSKIMKESENYIAFRCYDCMQSVSSCICAQCFVDGNHKGHNYVQYQAINGCCDCGNDQSWNEKGNCKSHGKINEQKPIIESDVKDQYLKQFRLAFWVYFYLSDYKKVTKYRQQYGNALFGYLITLSQQNYEMKYLAYLLLSQPLSVQYKGIDADSQSTILHRLFKVKPAQQLNTFVQLTFEVFPVEEFRIIIIQQYFAKMKKKEEVLTRTHQLSMLNFQFLSCVKLINKLIEKGQIQPFLLYPYKFIGNSINLPQAFKKYYEDLDYIKNMRSSKEYAILHLTKSNVCDLCFYRQYTILSKAKHLEEFQIMEYNLDELFLKTFGQFVKNIIDQKKLIEKCLSQLVQYIIDADVNAISLAHERAFALLTFGYFNGNIYELLSEQTCKNFAKAILLEDINIVISLKTIISNSLITKTYIQQKAEYQMDHNPHEKYFFSRHPQKNFNEFLDISFHKIMMMICQHYTDYSAIIEYTLSKRIIEITKETESRMQSMEDCNDQEKDGIMFLIYSKYYVFLNFINSISRVKIDQIVISNYIGIKKEKEIFNFYSRLLTSFKDMNIKDFKNLALSIINCQQTLELFIKQKCTVDKGRIKCLQQVQPLQSSIYYQIFKKYDKKLTQIEPYFLKKSVKLSQFKEFVILNSRSIEEIMETNMNYLFRLTPMEFNKKSSGLFSLICFEFLKIYLENNSTKEKSFFQNLLQNSFRPLITKQLLQQITIIQKNEELESERGRIKIQQQDFDKKRREKLVAKKKQKQMSLKMAQAKILKSYETDIKNLQGVEQHINYCIYCKQTKNQELNFISYIGLTNFYERIVMKQEGYHVYFESCGHKIHRSCFDIVTLKNKSNYCFLCKRETNILIPEISQNKDMTIDRDRSIDVITSFHAAIINQRESIKPQLKEEDQFLNKPELNFYESLVDGLCKDILFLGLQDDLSYQRSRYLIHYELFLLLKASNECEIKEIFKNTKPNGTNQLSLLLKYVHFKLESIVLGYQDQSNSNMVSEEMETIDLFFLKFSKIDNQTPIKNLNLFNSRKLFIELPQNLSQMTMYIGQCKICKHVTNYIYICLKCNWSCCRICLNVMYKHNGTTFISCTNGAVKYLHSGKIFQDDSIYQNYLGESYLEITSHLQMTKYEKFTLNTRKLQTLHKMALEYGIHQKIFLNDR